MTYNTPHSAAGSLSGYIWQLRLALLALLRASHGQKIEIEAYDDIAIRCSDGHVRTCIQAKHSQSQSTITENSVDLWKTLRVWSDLVQTGKIDINDEVEFSLATTDTASKKISALSSKIKNESEIENLRRLLDRIARNKNNNNILPCYQSWLNLKLAPQRSKLLSKIIIIESQKQLPKIFIDIDEKISTMGFRSAQRPEVRERLIGWFDSIVSSKLNSGKCAITPSDLNDIIVEIQTTMRSHSLVTVFGDEQISVDLKSEIDKNFIKQLILINAKNEELVYAYKMHKQAISERERWINSKILGHIEINSFDAEIKNTWDDIRIHLPGDLAPNSMSNEELGRIIFRKCTEKRCTIAGQNTAIHVHIGSCHILSDRLDIGWHPEYEKLVGTI